MVYSEPVTLIDKIVFLLNTHAPDLSDKFWELATHNTFFNQFVWLLAEANYVALDDGLAAVVEAYAKFLDCRTTEVTRKRRRWMTLLEPLLLLLESCFGGFNFLSVWAWVLNVHLPTLQFSLLLAQAFMIQGSLLL